MTDMDQQEALLRLVADALLHSDAPRFLLSLVTLPEGEHRLVIDLPEVEPEHEAWLLVSGTEDGRRARLSFVSAFDAENAAGTAMPAVWHHYLIERGVLREAKTLEETLPASFDYVIDLESLAGGSAAIEDLCDACGLVRDPGVAGRDAPPPLESAPPA